MRMVTYVRASIVAKIELAARLQQRKTGRIIEDQFKGDIKNPGPDNVTQNKIDVPEDLI